MRTEIVLFEGVPDAARLATEVGLAVEAVDEALAELAHILKTSTRLGFLVDLAITDEDWDHVDDEVWQRTREHRYFGHTNAFDLNETNGYSHTVDLIDAALALHDRSGMSMDDVINLVTAFAGQVDEVDVDGVEMKIARRAIGYEKDIEAEVEQDPSVLAFHGYVVTSVDRQPHFGTSGRGDLVCELVDGSLLVIELKRWSIVEEHLEQIQRYMAHLRQTQPGRQVRGLPLGDGIDWLGHTSGWPIAGWPDDIDAVSARHLDLPSGRAQRWLWWHQPPDPYFTPDAVVAVAANGRTPVRVWERSGRPSPGSTAEDLDDWERVAGWSRPVPLSPDWGPDPDAWTAGQIEALARAAIAEDHAAE